MICFLCRTTLFQFYGGKLVMTANSECMFVSLRWHAARCDPDGGVCEYSLYLDSSWTGCTD